MLSEKKNSENIQNFGNEQLNNSFRQINNEHQNNNVPRGFNVFLQYGMSPNELRTLRVIYHLSYLHNSIINNRNIDLSAQAIYQREENWLRAQINNNLRGQNNYNRTNILIRNPRNNTISIYVNDVGNRFRQRRYHRQIHYEQNINFLIGIILGMILNIFSLCILMLTRTRIKFKVGLIFGMLISIIFTFPFLLEPKIKYI